MLKLENLIDDKILTGNFASSNQFKLVCKSVNSDSFPETIGKSQRDQ